MRDTPRMDIFAACCVPVFVKSLKEVFFLFGRKAKLPDKKDAYNCFLKTCQILCQHEWVGPWSLVSANCRKTHTHRHTLNHVAAKWQQTHICILLKGRMCIYIFICLIFHIYIYIYLYTQTQSYIIYIFAWCRKFSDMTWGFILHQFCSGCWGLWWAVFPALYFQRSIEPMLPRIWGFCTRLLHAIYLFMQ